MGVVRDLVTKYTLIVNDAALQKLNAAIDKTNEKLQSVAAKSDGINKLSDAFNTLATAAAAFSAIELAKKAEEAIEKYALLGQQIKITANSLGLGVEQFQALGYAAAQSGVSQEQLTHSLAHLSRHLYDAKVGSKEALQVFQYMGVPVHQITNIHNAQQALMLLSSRVTQIRDPMERMALVTKVMGRGSIEMVNMLAAGPGAIGAAMGKASREGLTLTDLQVQYLNRIKMALIDIGTKWQTIMASYIAPLAPVIERIVDDFIKFYNANEKWIGLNVQEFVVKILTALGFLDGFISTFVGNLSRHFKGKGIIGAIFGDVSIVATVIAALAAVGASVKLIMGILEFSGILPILRLAARLLGIGEAGAAAGAAGAAEAGAAGAAGAAAGGIGLGGAGLAIGTGLLLKKLTDYIALGGLEDDIKNAYQKLGVSGAPNIPIAPGSIPVPATLPGNVTQTNHTTIHVSGAGQNPEELARHIDKRINDHHNQKMRETHRAVKGAKVTE